MLQDQCHQNTVCADGMALVWTEVLRLLTCVSALGSPGTLKHCIASFICHDTDVFSATRTQLRSLLMEKSLWLYSAGVCGHADIHQWARTVPNWHLEWADKSVIVIINCSAFVKWVFEACVPARPNYFTDCPFDVYVM